MNFSFTNLSYKQTGFFSSIVIDYLDQSPKLRPFYDQPGSKQGIEELIKARQGNSVNRTVLVEHLNNQYKSISTSTKVSQNIISLKEKNSFTITTAHQPALFTGTLYFIYKIIHAIKLADQLNTEYPANHFVPVYWMGSEDADLDELGKFYLSGEKIVWDTKQTGAVGKMNTKGLDKLINRIDGELSVFP
ncbi:MAG: bacillithiol biosynthesis BshC, partial [Chitinophagaceae bacterium]